MLDDSAVQLKKTFAKVIRKEKHRFATQSHIMSLGDIIEQYTSIFHIVNFLNKHYHGEFQTVVDAFHNQTLEYRRMGICLPDLPIHPKFEGNDKGDDE